MAVCFDSKGPTFRHDMFPDYKANRPPMPDEMAQQIPWIKRVTEGFRIPIIELTGYEADDLIGTLSIQAQAKGYAVVMVTGDKDFVQLVTPSAEIWDPMKEATIDLASIEEKYGLRPAQMIDVQGLSGDATDNVPGVPGIGQKTAVSLITAFGSMDAVYEALDTIKKPKQKENLDKYRDQAFMSRRLVTIATDAPVAFDPDAFVVGDPDHASLSALFQELEFRQLQKAFTASAKKIEKKYSAVTTAEALDAVIAEAGKANLIAVDTETTSQHPMLARAGRGLPEHVGRYRRLHPLRSRPRRGRRSAPPRPRRGKTQAASGKPRYPQDRTEHQIRLDRIEESRHRNGGNNIRHHAGVISAQPFEARPQPRSDRSGLSGPPDDPV
jgi:DNA polymerase-1